MFGKEIDNTAEELRSLCTKITDGTHQSPQFVQEGIPFIFISNIKDYKINYDTEKYISQETYDELTKNTAIELGDVLLTIVGSYGNPAVVDVDKKFCFQRHIAQLKPKHDLVNSYYLHTALKIPYVREQIDRSVKGIAQKTLNLSELSKVKINVPELSKQNEFVSFVQATDKLKVEVQKSLGETQILFNSLMQKYFE
jgi:type I restriction enzyme S subunit